MTQDAASWLAGKEKLCRTGNVLVYIFVSFAWRSSQPPFETVRLSQVDFNDKAREKGPVRLSPRLFNVYDSNISLPQHTHPCPHPLFISQGKKDWHIYALLPVSQLLEFELVGVLRGEKCLFVGITFFVFLIYIFSLFHKKSKQGKKRKLNVVEMFQNHPGVRCCSTLIC